MRVSRGRLCAGLVAVLTSLGASSASGEQSLSSPATSEFAHESILVVEPAQWLLGFEQESAQREALRAEPTVAELRTASELRFARLDARQSAGLARSTFPWLVARRAGGLPSDPRGGRLGPIISDHAVAVTLPGGKHSVIESLEPISVKTAAGQVPIDLSLRETNGGYTPKTPVAGLGLEIPKTLSSGPALRDVGVSLVPVDDHGLPLASASGVIDGATVFYGNSERASAGVMDMDTLVKPETLGFSEEAILRSERSPDRLAFKVGMPRGARLIQRHGARSIQVVSGGRSIATIAAPAAVDAEGTQIPLTIGLSGGLMTISFQREPGQYRYPVVVDPTAKDAQLDASGSHTSNWHFDTVGNWYGKENSGGAGWTEYIPEYHEALDFGAFEYETQGASSIKSVEIKGHWNDTGSQVDNELLISAPNGTIEAEKSMPEQESSSSWSIYNYGKTAENGAEWRQDAWGTGGKAGENTLEGATVEITQPEGAKADFNTMATEVGGELNALHGSSNWLGRGTAIEIVAKDPGVGVSQIETEYHNPGGKYITLSNRNILTEGPCSGVQCPLEQVEILTYSPLLEDGTGSIRVRAADAAEWGEHSTWYTVKVDGTPPHNIVINGLPSNHQLLPATYYLTAEATDGSGSTASSGVKSIALALDGKEIGSASGSCTPGPCTAHSNPWGINASELAAGEHTLEVTAKDNAGNSVVETTTVTVPSAHPIALGPGEVYPRSGEYLLETTDVSQGDGLTVSRSYGSQHLTSGASGPLGPQWAIGIGPEEGLTVQPDGNVALTDDSGKPLSFVKSGSSYTPPSGDGNLTLVYKEGTINEYVLSNSAKGTSTHFTLPAGGGVVWEPTSTTGTTPAETTTYTYETKEVSGYKVTRPAMALAPAPSGVSCVPELKAGCRALTFVYATSKTATGEGASEWGNVVGGLTKVYLTFYNRKGGGMSTIAVAEYAYDAQGRLRAEWDPRISPALKTTYGYDSEGHVTALTQPGQETWGFVYGTTAGDTGAGRILKVTQAPRSHELWSGMAVSNTSRPGISGTPIIGNRMAAETGRWKESPIVYGYQWEDCNSAGAECKPIAGATNPNYTPAVADGAHTLVAQVSATNGDGSVIAISAPSAPVAAAPGTVSQPLDSHALNSVSCIASTSDCVVTDLFGNAYYTTNASASTAATWQHWGVSAPNSDAVDCPSTSLCLMGGGIALSGRGSVYSATSLGGEWKARLEPAQGVLSISCPNTSFCAAGGTAGSDDWSTEPTGSWSTVRQVPNVEDELDTTSCVSSSFCAAASSKGVVYVANTTTKVKSTEWVKTDVDGTTALRGIACVSTSSCVAVDTAGSALRLSISAEGKATATATKIDGSNGLTAVTCTASTTCVAVDNQGNVFVSLNNAETWNLAKRMSDDLTAVSCATESLCVATDTVGVAQTFNPSAEVTTEPIDPSNSLNAISCRTGTTTCVVADSKGNEFYATNVTGSTRATWKSWSGPAASSAQAIECTESSTCLLAVNGDLYYATSLGGSWTLAYSPTYGVDAISCASASFCVAGQSNGFYRYSKNPTSSAWTGPGSQGLATIKAVSCVPNGTQQFCAMGDSSGNVHIATTTAQVESGTSWKETKIDSASIESISCVSSSRCTAVDSAGNSLKMTISEEGIPTVKVVNFDGTSPVASIACTTYGICVAVDNKGNVFAGESYGSTWSLKETFPSGLTSVSCESGEHCFATDTAGDVLTLYSSTISQGAIKSPQPGQTVEYGVPVSGTGAPNSLTTAEIAKWSQSDAPSEATAIFPSDEPMGWPASDYRRANIYYRDSAQREVNVATPAGGISTVEYNEQNDVKRELSADNRAAALAEGSNSAAASLKLDAENTYSSDGTELLSTLGPRHMVKLPSGEEVLARRHAVYSYDEGAPEGGPYRLVTKTTEGAQLEAGGEQDVRTTTNSYSGQSNLGWTLREPTSVTTDPSGLKLTKTFLYDSGTGNVTETRNPGSAGEKDPHDKVMVYYSAAANSKYPGCGSHPEWANLLCETTPGAQPGTSGLPELPTTVISYNDLLSPSSVTQTSKSASRKQEYAFDAADRPTEVTYSSTEGSSLPAVNFSYETTTGLMNKESTYVNGVTTKLIREHNTLGQLSSYTDSFGNASTYEYDVDGRLTSVNDGKGLQSYTYDPTSGLETELTDAAVGKVTATYDVEGNLLTEAAPDGITSKWAYNPAGEAVEVSDTKSSSCGTSCTWFSQTETPSIHGQTASQTNSLTQAKYAYDQDGRLTEVSETPTGQGCTVRLYGYDQEDNMASLNTRAPGAEGKCASSGGTVESHSYDSGNRLTGSGVKYDEFGDTTVLPGVDAGGSELLSGYYVNGRLASVSQAGQTISYKLDPSLRTDEVIDTGTKSSTTIEHYASGGDDPSWTVDLAGNWTRDVHGIGGGLIAIQSNGEAPTMQLSNLEGDVVATASSSPTATALLSSTRSTEFGVPTTTTPPRYSWLGADQRPVELASGMVAMGARGYIPQLGRFLQPDPRRGGSDNPYGYANDDPLNESDLSGEYIDNGYLHAANVEAKELAIERHLAEEEAKREEAEQKAEEAEEAAELAAEAYASGGGKKGKKGKAMGKASAYSSNSCGWAEICEAPQIKVKCDAQCKAKRLKEEEKRTEKERRKKEEKERFEKELECGHVVAGYRPDEDKAVGGDGLYYGSARSKDIYCGPDGGDPTAPCWGDCEGGFEAWQQWPGHEHSRRPNEPLQSRSPRNVVAVRT